MQFSSSLLSFNKRPLTWDRNFESIWKRKNMACKFENSHWVTSQSMLSTYFWIYIQIFSFLSESDVLSTFNFFDFHIYIFSEIAVFEKNVYSIEFEVQQNFCNRNKNVRHKDCVLWCYVVASVFIESCKPNKMSNYLLCICVLFKEKESISLKLHYRTAIFFVFRIKLSVFKKMYTFFWYIFST